MRIKRLLLSLAIVLMTCTVSSSNQDNSAASSQYSASAAWDESQQSPQVTINGTLKMLLTYYGEGARVEKYTTNKGEVKYRLIPDEDADPWIMEYYELDEEGAYIAFVLVLDQPMEVLPYISESEAECTDPVMTKIMLVPRSNESGKKFAEKYANKHISATGSLYAPCGGAHNVTETVMDLQEIVIK